MFCRSLARPHRATTRAYRNSGTFTGSLRRLWGCCSYGGSSRKVVADPLAPFVALTVYASPASFQASHSSSARFLRIQILRLFRLYGHRALFMGFLMQFRSLIRDPSPIRRQCISLALVQDIIPSLGGNGVAASARLNLSTPSHRRSGGTVRAGPMFLGRPQRRLSYRGTNHHARPAAANRPHGGE
jgi:hypothetical protein